MATPYLGYFFSQCIWSYQIQFKHSCIPSRSLRAEIDFEFVHILSIPTEYLSVILPL